MKRTRKKHNAVIKLLSVVDPVRMNAELTCQLSDRPVPPRGGERFFKAAARMLGKRSLEKRCPSDGGPMVRIHLPPAERWYGAGGEEMAPSSL